MDDEPKYGLSVTGIVEIKDIIKIHGVKTGDILFMTKKIGGGILTTAHKGDLLTLEDLAELIKNMKRLLTVLPMKTGRPVLNIVPLPVLMAERYLYYAAPGLFFLAPVRTRMKIVVAGPLMNVLFGVFALALAYMIGLPHVEEPPIIGFVYPGSPAEKAGFKNGDVVIEVDGVRVKGPTQFRQLILNTEPGTETNMKVIRDGKEIELKVKIGERAGEGKTPSLFTWRGISLQELTDELAKRFGYEGEEGVLVANVKSGSPGYEAGIQPGDLITDVERKPVSSIDQFKERVKGLKGDVLLHLRRGKGALFVVVKK